MVIMLAKKWVRIGDRPRTVACGAGNASKIGSAREGFDVLVHDKAPPLANADSTFILACTYTRLLEDARRKLDNHNLPPQKFIENADPIHRTTDATVCGWHRSSIRICYQKSKIPGRIRDCPLLQLFFAYLLAFQPPDRRLLVRGNSVVLLDG